MPSVFFSPLGKDETEEKRKNKSNYSQNHAFGTDSEGHVFSSIPHFIGKDTEVERLDDLPKIILPVNDRVTFRTNFPTYIPVFFLSIYYTSS